MAAKEYVLHINVHNLGNNSQAKKQLEETTTGESGSSDESSDKGKFDKLKSAIKKVAAGLSIAKPVLETAKAELDWQINSYSARYHNTARANQIKNIQKTGGVVADAAGNVATAAATGGWIAALAVAALEVGKMAMDINRNLMDYTMKQETNKFEEIRASERLGLQLSDRNRNR